MNQTGTSFGLIHSLVNSQNYFLTNINANANRTTNDNIKQQQHYNNDAINDN